MGSVEGAGVDEAAVLPEHPPLLLKMDIEISGSFDVYASRKEFVLGKPFGFHP